MAPEGIPLPIAQHTAMMMRTFLFLKPATKSALYPHVASPSTKLPTMAAQQETACRWRRSLWGGGGGVFGTVK